MSAHAPAPLKPGNPFADLRSRSKSRGSTPLTTTNMAGKAKKENMPPVSLKRIKDEMEDEVDAKDLVEERPLKREKSSASETPVSRSVTPLVPLDPVAFDVLYPNPNKSGPREQALMEQAEFLVSPFEAKRATKKGELDLYFSVQPSSQWESMRKYNNFVSKFPTEWEDM
jgi:hypothetical protein